MVRRKIGLASGVIVVLAAVVQVPTATAEVRATTAACVQRIGLETSGGTFGGWDVTGTKPPTVKPSKQTSFSAATANATWYYRTDPTIPATQWYGYSIRGTGLYFDSLTYRPGAAQPEPKQEQVGHGWGGFTQIATTGKEFDGGFHFYLYGLRNGVLYRYNRDTGIRSLGSAKGFSSVKAMTVISETPTYDTLLATTRGGALYTIRIPVTSPMKPIVKQVRSATWQNFESLVADSCGQNGILLTAVDHDADTAYLYTLGHANGTATVIRNLGKIPAVANGQTHFAMMRESKDVFGE
jgi:hypothetical protein